MEVLKINSPYKISATDLNLIEKITNLIILKKNDELKFILNEYINSSNQRYSVNFLHNSLYDPKSTKFESEINKSIWDDELKKIISSKNWAQDTFNLILNDKDLSIIKKIKLNKESKIASIGSCFARNVSNQFISLGYSNMYTIGIEESANSPRLLNTIYLDSNFMGDPEKKFDQRVGFKNENFAKLVKQLDILIITYGVGFDLVNSKTNEIISNLKNISQSIKSGEYIFKFPTIEEQSNYISSSIKNIRKINPHLPIFVTVSPVPLSGYVGDNHVFTANTISKSNLILSVQEAKKIANFIYIPTYELITSIAPAITVANLWGDAKTKRHPNENLVKEICKAFINLFNN
jgi:hypothetical protein